MASASFCNDFELEEGQLVQQDAGRFRVDFYGDYQEYLSPNDVQLVQQASEIWPEQRFIRSPATAVNALLASSFEQALHCAYLGGGWTTRQGLGKGGLVPFHPAGRVEGLHGAERAAPGRQLRSHERRVRQPVAATR